MKKSISLILLIIFSLFGCGGGGGGSSVNTSPEVTTIYKTGNESFDPVEAEKSDIFPNQRNNSNFNSSLLPSSIDWSSYLPEVGNQDQTNSCTAWSSTYYYKTVLEAIEEGWNPNTHAFSPKFQYSLQSKIGSTIGQYPTNFLIAIQSLKQNGAIFEKDFPWDSEFTTPFSSVIAEFNYFADLEINEDKYIEALKYKNYDEYKLPSSVNDIRFYLNISPILVGINNYVANPKTGNISYLNTNSNVGHAILVVGYDDAKFGEGAYKFVNSWGKAWGDNGFGYIKYSEFAKIMQVSYIIKDETNFKNISVTEKPTTPSNLKALEDAGYFIRLQWDKVDNAETYTLIREENDTKRQVAITGLNYFLDFDISAGTDYKYYILANNSYGSSVYSSGVTVKSKGEKIITPIIQWVSNTSKESVFTVSNIDAKTVCFLVYIAQDEASDDFTSYGQIDPTNSITINWPQGGGYEGKKPVVKIRAYSANGFSAFSEKAEVGQKLPYPSAPTTVTNLSVSPSSTSITLNWGTSSSNFDYFVVYRTNPYSDYSGYTLVDYTFDSTYTDYYTVKGVTYQYAVAPVYKNAYGVPAESEITANILTKANLVMYNVYFNVGNLVNRNVDFEATIRNDGVVSVSDYDITVYAQNIFTGQTIKVGTALGSILTPTPKIDPGFEITYDFTATLADSFIDGNIYRWIIAVDDLGLIDEEIDWDNYIITNDIFYTTGFFNKKENARSKVLDSNNDKKGKQQKSKAKKARWLSHH